MLAKHWSECKEFRAMDNTNLRELLHPKNDNVNLPCSIALARLAPGTASLLHQINTTEFYYILQGTCIIHIDKEEKKLTKGTLAYIPAYTAQFIQNIGENDLLFLCIVIPAWKKNREKIIDRFPSPEKP
jgi:mannose-6-phosphate isomerase-like protein (cupin superfamily)